MTLAELGREPPGWRRKAPCVCVCVCVREQGPWPWTPQRGLAEVTAARLPRAPVLWLGNRQWPGGVRSTAEREGSSAPCPARKPVQGESAPEPCGEEEAAAFEVRV